MGCPSWNSCCRRWWGRCIGCPGWNSCCWTTPDVICEAANAGCRVLRGIAYAALWVAEKLVRAATAALDVAKAILEGVKIAVKAGADAAAAIIRFTLGGLINIFLIEFDIKIGLVSSGHFRGRIEVSFLRRHHVSLSFSLRLKSIQEMALDLADAVFPSISGRSRRDVAERLRRHLPDYSHRHYFPDQYVRPSGAGKRRRSTLGASYGGLTGSVGVVAKLRMRRAFDEVDRDIDLTLAHVEEFRRQLVNASTEPAIPRDGDRPNGEDEVEIVPIDNRENIGKEEVFIRALDVS